MDAEARADLAEAEVSRLILALKALQHSAVTMHIGCDRYVGATNKFLWEKVKRLELKICNQKKELARLNNAPRR